MPVVTVPAPLRRQLGDEASDGLIELINAAVDDSRADIIEFVGERFERRLAEELAKVRVEISQVEARLDSRISSETAKLGERIAQTEAALRVEMQKTRSDLIRWMFAFWIGQTVVTATLFTLLK